jgi:hypothetical protein
MRAIKYIIASLLLTSGTAFSQTETTSHEINLTKQNSSLVKIRVLKLKNDPLPPTLHGRITRSYFSRDIEPGFINADVMDANGDVIEQRKWELEYLYDGDNSLFSSFEIPLSSSLSKIKDIHITHQGYK